MNLLHIGERITQLRKQKGWSQNDLAKAIEASIDLIGKYECDEVKPTIGAAKNIADAFEVSLDYLVGEGQNASFDKKTLQRIDDLELLEENKKKTLFYLIDTYIRDAKTRQAYFWDYLINCVSCQK